MLYRSLIAYLCAWFIMAPQTWAGRVYAQEPQPPVQPASQPANQPANQPAAEPRVRQPIAQPAGDQPAPEQVEAAPEEDDRQTLREELLLASWQLRDIVRETIPGALRFWMAEAHALFDPISHCGDYYNKVPTQDLADVLSLVASAQTAFVAFFEKHRDDFGNLASVQTFDRSLPDIVTSEQTGVACQPIVALRQEFHDDSGKQPEDVQRQQEWLQLSVNNQLLTPYVASLSRKRVDSAYTDLEARQWLGWMGAIRKFANLLAHFHEINKTYLVQPKLPEIAVSTALGKYFARLLGETVASVAEERLKSQSTARSDAQKILSSSFSQEYATRFVPCETKVTACGTGTHPDFRPAPGQYCFCDGKEESSRMMDEQIILTLQTRDPKEPNRTTHGTYMNAMRVLGIKALSTELALANQFLPLEKRANLPEACTNERAGDDVKEYVKLFDRINSVQKREWELQNLANAVDRLHREYLEGTRVVPVPDPTAAVELYKTAHQLVSEAVLSRMAFLTQTADKPETRAAIETEARTALGRIAAVSFAERVREGNLAEGDTLSAILAHKLRLWATLMQEDFQKIEGDGWTPHKKAVVAVMLETVVVEAFTDVIEDYLTSFFTETKHILASDLQEDWHQRFRSQWREAVESVGYRAEMARIAQTVADTLFSFEEMHRPYDPQAGARELIASQVRRFAPDMMDASLTDIPGARAASQMPTFSGEGWQSPVFPLDPKKPLDYQHLKKGFQHIAKSYATRLTERYEEDPRYRDDVWLQQNMRQVVYHPDGTAEEVRVKSTDALVAAIIEKFIETSEADPANDFDWSAMARRSLLDPLMDWLKNDWKKAEQTYEKERLFFAKQVFYQFLFPMIRTRDRIDENVWLTHFNEVLDTIGGREIIVPFRWERPDRARKILDAYTSHIEAKEGFGKRYALFLQVMEERKNTEGELVTEKVLTPAAQGNPAANFIAYVEKRKGLDETQSALKWLFPFRAENHDILEAFYEARIVVNTNSFLKNFFLPAFGVGQPEYPGEAALIEAAKTDPKLQAARLKIVPPMAQFFVAWFGYLDRQDPANRDKQAEVKAAIDAFLIEASKIAHAPENEKKEIDQMVTLLEEPLRKKIDELGIAGHWIARADKAYGELRPAIEAADAERLAASYLRFRELVGAELQLLAQGKDALGNWAETRQSDKTFEEEVLPDLVLPTFAEFVHAVNNWVITLTTPQAATLFPNEPLRNPYQQVVKLQEELADLDYWAEENEREGKFHGELAAETLERRSHLIYMIERSRNQIAATENLKRALRNYLPNESRAKAVVTKLDQASYGPLWSAYYEDQFLTTTSDKDGAAMVMSPSRMLEDLNAIAQVSQGLLPVEFYNAQTYLGELKAYCEAASGETARDAFTLNYRRLLLALGTALLASPAALIQYRNGVNLDNEDVRRVGRLMERVARIWNFKPAPADEEDLADWALGLLAGIVSPESWIGFPTALEFCAEASARATALEEKLKAHAKELTARKLAPMTLPQSLAQEYGELVQVVSDVLYSADSAFGPLVVAAEDGSVEKAVWFTSGPYLQYYKEEKKKEKKKGDETEPKKDDAAEEKTPAVATERPEKPVDIATATKALVAFARLDLPPIVFENVAGDLAAGPTVGPVKLFTSESPEVRVAAVQSLPPESRIALYGRAKKHLIGIIRNPEAHDQFSPTTTTKAPGTAEPQPSVAPGTVIMEPAQAEKPVPMGPAPMATEPPKDPVPMGPAPMATEPPAQPMTTEPGNEPMPMSGAPAVAEDGQNQPAPQPQKTAFDKIKDSLPAELRTRGESDPVFRGRVVRTMTDPTYAGLASRVKDGDIDTVDELNRAFRDWPIDRYAAEGAPESLLKDAKSSPRKTETFFLAMGNPRLKAEVLAGKFPTMQALALAIEKSRVLFTSSVEDALDYEKWQSALAKSIVAWNEMKRRDPQWGVIESFPFDELSLEIFGLFFHYLPFRLKSRVEAVGILGKSTKKERPSGQEDPESPVDYVSTRIHYDRIEAGEIARGGAFAEMIAEFHGYHVADRNRVIEDIVALVKLETLETLNEAARTAADRRTKIAELGLSVILTDDPAKNPNDKPITEYPALTIQFPTSSQRDFVHESNPFGEGRPAAFQKPGFKIIETASGRLMRFYAEYFSDEAIPPARALYRTIDDWRAHYAKRAKDGSLVYTTYYDTYEFKWAPLGQRLDEAGRFTEWMGALLDNEAARQAFEKKRAEKRPPFARQRLWNHFESLEAFASDAKKPLYRQVVGLLEVFDRNATATPEPYTYPFFLALVNWKTNPNRYGQLPPIGPGPAKKPGGQRLYEEIAALVKGQPSPNPFKDAAEEGLKPRPTPLMQYHLAGLMGDLVREMRIDLKDFDGWEKVLDRSADETHQIVASSARFGMVGIRSSRFANTSVMTINTANPNLGPDYETRFFPVLPTQRTSFLPAETFEEYAEMIDRPATYFPYAVNVSDEEKRPLYKQLTSVQGRMVGIAEVLSDSPNLRTSLAEVGGKWDAYQFGGNRDIPESVTGSIVERAEAVGLRGVDAAEVAQLIKVREMYVDFLEKASQLISKYHVEDAISGDKLPVQTARLAIGEGISDLLNFVTIGWVVSVEGADELDKMLARYKAQIGWDGVLVSCKTGPSHRWVANAVWQAGVMTQWRAERSLDRDRVERQRNLLAVIDDYFAMYVQGIEYRKGVETVASNILPRLEDLCEATWVKDVQSDEDFEKVEELIKESNILYYENLGLFLNQFLEDGNNTETYRLLTNLKAQKDKWHEFMEGVGAVVHVAITIMLVTMLMGRNPAGSRFTSTAAGQAINTGVQMIILLYFSWELYDGLAEDYWGGRGTIDFLMGNRDTQIEGNLPLIRDESGFIIDVAEDDLIARQNSIIRWSWRVWLALLVFQQLSWGQRVIRGGMRWALQKVSPQTYTRFRMWSEARRFGLDPKSLRNMTPKEASERIRAAYLDKLDDAFGSGATRFDDVYELNPAMARMVEKDIDAQLAALCKELQLHPGTLEPLPLTGWPSTIARITRAREEARPVIDQLWALRHSMRHQRLLSHDDVAFLFAGRDTAFLPGMGHPVHRLMPHQLLWTGFPPELYALGPTSRKLGKLYRLAQGQSDLSNLATFHYLGAWREAAHGELQKIARHLHDDIATLRQQRVDHASGRLAELDQQLARGELSKDQYKKLVADLKLVEGANRSDIEEVLYAMIDPQHALHSHFRFTGEGRVLRAQANERGGDVEEITQFTLGRVGGRPDHVSEELAQYAKRLREIAQYGAITPRDFKIMRAIAERDYYALSREFSRPTRVAGDWSNDESRPEGASTPATGTPASGAPAQPAPAVSDDVAANLRRLLEETPAAGIRSPHVTDSVATNGARLSEDMNGLDWARCWELAVQNESAESREIILSLARTRLSSESLSRSFGEHIRFGKLGQSPPPGASLSDAELVQFRAYRIAIAYTRDIELAVETARVFGSRSANAYFMGFYRSRLHSYANFVGDAPSIAQARAMFNIEPSANIDFGALVRRAEGLEAAGVDSNLVGRARQALEALQPGRLRAPGQTLEDFARASEVPLRYLEHDYILSTLTNGRGVVGNTWMGRKVPAEDLAQMRTLFGSREILTAAEARSVLRVSPAADEAQIRSAIDRTRAELSQRAFKSNHQELAASGDSIPASEQKYVDALKRVEEAERILLGKSGPGAPPGEPPAPQGPNAPAPPTGNKPGPQSPAEPPTATGAPTAPMGNKPAPETAATGNVPPATGKAPISSVPSVPVSGASTPLPGPQGQTMPAPKPQASAPRPEEVLTHPVVERFVGAPGSAKPYSREVAEPLAAMGPQRARTLVLDREVELAEETNYLASQQATLQRLLQAALWARDAQSAGAIGREVADFERVFRVMLNSYVMPVGTVRYPMGISGALHAAHGFLDEAGFAHTLKDLQDVTWLADDASGYLPALAERRRARDEGDLTPEQLVRLRQGAQAFYVLVDSQYQFFLRGEDGRPVMLGGLGIEGMALATDHEVPLEILLQDEILSDETLLSFYMRHGASDGAHRARIFRILFLDRAPEKAGVLVSEKLVGQYQATRMVFEIDRRLDALAAKGSLSSIEEDLAEKLTRARQRLAEAGFVVPERAGATPQRRSRLIYPGSEGGNRSEGNEEGPGTQPRLWVPGR